MTLYITLLKNIHHILCLMRNICFRYGGSAAKYGNQDLTTLHQMVGVVEKYMILNLGLMTQCFITAIQFNI